MKEEDKQRNYKLAANLIAQQNFAAAIIIGAGATVLAAALYGILTAIWNFSYGFVAAAIGIIIGISMQYLGRGIETKFAVAAFLYTIAGCVLGNLFRVIMSMSIGSATSPLEVWRTNEFSLLAGRAQSYISLIDLVFWFVAVWLAVFLVKRPLSRKERIAIGMYELNA